MNHKTTGSAIYRIARFLRVISVAILTTAIAAGQVTINSIVSTAGGATISSPEAVYADPYGNIFVANTAGTSVIEIPANGGPVLTVATGLTSIVGVVADHAGNVYVAQSNVTSILKVPVGGGATSTLGTGISRPFQMAMDAADNLYVTDSGNARIVKLAPSSGAQSTLAFTGLTNPHGVAVDNAGNIYATSFSGTPQVTEFTAAGVQVSLPITGMTSPYGIAVDAQGRLDVVDAGGTGRLLQYAPPFTAAEMPVSLVGAVGSGARTVSVTPSGDVVYHNNSKLSVLEAVAANTYGTAVSGASGVSAITFSFASTKKLGTPVFSSNGASTPQFKDGGSSTCTNNKTIAANATCVVNVVFAPTEAGLSTGTLMLVDSTGAALAVVPLTGVGDAPVAAFTPGTQDNALSSLGAPEGVALDAGGDVYTVDAVRAAVMRTTSAGVSTTLGFSGLARPFGVAVDGTGSVYVSDMTNGAVYKLSTAGIQTTLLSGLSSPMGIALDAQGALYVANNGKATVVKLDVLGNQSTLGFGGLSSPAWVAVDVQGDVFVSDSGSVQELAVGKSGSSILSLSGLGAPAGLATGLNGALYVADSTNGDVVALSASGTTTMLGSGIAAAAGLAVAPSGTLYVASPSAGVVAWVDRTHQTLMFPPTAVGSTSAAMVSSLQNLGNETLTLSGLTVSAGFVQVTPLAATDCSSSSSIGSGASCAVNVVFSPVVLGSNSGSVTLTDNALNASGATQTIQLTGTSLRSSTTSVVQSTPSSGNATYGQSVVLTATAAAQSGSGTPTGTVQFAIDGGTPSAAISLSGGQANYTATGLAAGPHTVVVSYSGDVTFAGSTSSSLGITVAPAVLTVTAVSQTRMYGVANSALTYTITGFQYADTASVVSGAAVLNTTATVTSDPNTYPITVAQGTLAAADYSFTEVAGTVTVTQASQTITFQGPANATYGASPVSLAATSSSGLAVSYSVVSGPATVTNGAGAAVTITGAGPVRIAANQPGNMDYAAAPQQVQSFVVAPAVLTVTADNLSKQTGQANPALTYSFSGFVRGDTATVVAGVPALSTTATASSASGSYPIAITQGSLAAANYSFVFVNGILTVTGNTPQTITFGTLPNVSWGAGPVTLAATASSGATVSYTVSGPASLSGNTLSIIGTGTVRVTASQAGNATYAAAQSVVQSFTVAPATLTVTPADVTRAINTPNPALLYTITGLVNGDTSGVVSGAPAITTTATTSSPVGTYPISASQGSLLAANYNFAFGTGTLTVTAATQTITFNSLPGVTYGASPVTLSASASSSLPVSYAVTGPASLAGSTLTITGVGTVSVTASQAGNATYAAATSVTQTFVVAPAPLTVTAQNATIAYGAAIPTSFTYAITGFVNGDSQSVVAGAPVLTTTATASSPGGTYPITPTVGTLNAANYSFTSFVPGTLTISADAQTITFAALGNIPQTITSVTLSATASSGLAVVYTNVTGPAILSGNVLTISGAGVVSVSATQPGDSNYAAATPVTQSFTVLASTTTTLTASTNTASQGAAVTLTAKITSKTAGTPSGTVTFFVGSAQVGNAVTVNGGAASLTTTAIPSGAVNLTAVYSGDGVFYASTSSNVAILIVASDFNVAATSTNLTIAAGQSGSTVITVTPVGGYANTISFSCTSLPSNLTCGFVPPALNFYPGTGASTAAQSTTLTITAAAQTGANKTDAPSAPWARKIELATLLFLLPFAGSRRRRGLARLMAIGLLSVGIVAVSGCGSSSAKPGGTYNIQVNMNDGTPVSHSLTVTVTVQ